MGVCVSIGYVKGRERGTEMVCVSVGYVKGRKGQWVCVRMLYERKRERDRVSRLCEIVRESYRVCVSLCRICERKRERNRVSVCRLCERRERGT